MDPLLSAQEMTDPHVDHLTLMTYISKFQNVTARKSKDEKLIIRAKLDSIKIGDEVRNILQLIIIFRCLFPVDYDLNI